MPPGITGRKLQVLVGVSFPEFPSCHVPSSLAKKLHTQSLPSMPAFPSRGVPHRGLVQTSNPKNLTWPSLYPERRRTTPSCMYSPTSVHPHLTSCHRRGNRFPCTSLAHLPSSMYAKILCRLNYPCCFWFQCNSQVCPFLQHWFAPSANWLFFHVPAAPVGHHLHPLLP